MVRCPYCDQDYVWEVSVRDLPGPLYMCLECDTVWLTAGDISDREGQIFKNFMTQRGRPIDWKAITKIRQIDGRV
jgi:hypothetical protein